MSDLFTPDISVEAPPPPPPETPEEIALQREQVELLRQQREMLERTFQQQEAFGPRLEDIFNVQTDIAREQLRILQEQLPEQEALREEQLRRIAEEEREFGPLRRDIERGFLERSQAALRGELPVNPALLRGLEKSEEELRERLRRQLGPGFETSTPGIEALAEFGERRESLLEGARRADLTLAEQFGLARDASDFARFNPAFGAPDIPFFGGFDPFGGRQRLAGQFGTLSQLFQGPIANARLPRIMQFQSGLAGFDAATRASIASGMAGAQTLGALFGGLGQGVGTAAGLFTGTGLFG
ncbi:MAG: hypothetical protein ACE5JS_21700 [Nitrospinota bacterium]